METLKSARPHQGLLQPLLAVLLLSLLLTEVEAGGGGGRRRSKRGHFKCTGSTVAEYKLTFHGRWSQDRFPRMYPRHRPHAQWSKLVGRSHNSSYQMWRLGQTADPALKSFAERGDSSLYDTQPQGYEGVLDTFYAEPITRGEGWSATFLMVDGHHSKVSLAVKLVPSPDWFVGVDSLDLCRRGRWRARAHINLRPLDGGTDRGYTFTSPNWPSHPPEPVFQITPSFPDHPASAFLYPQHRRLPRLAFVEVQRVAQYLRKGALSPLKSDGAVNLKVFGLKVTPSTAAANTATPVFNATTTPKVKASKEAGHRSREATTVASPGLLTVASPGLLTVASPGLLTVASPGLLTVASPGLLKDSDKNLKAVVEPSMGSVSVDGAVSQSLHTGLNQQRFPATTVVEAESPMTTEPGHTATQQQSAEAMEEFSRETSPQLQLENGQLRPVTPTLMLRGVDPSKAKETQEGLSDMGPMGALRDSSHAEVGNKGRIDEIPNSRRSLISMLSKAAFNAPRNIHEQDSSSLTSASDPELTTTHRTAHMTSASLGKAGAAALSNDQTTSDLPLKSTAAIFTRTSMSNSPTTTERKKSNDNLSSSEMVSDQSPGHDGGKEASGSSASAHAHSRHAIEETQLPELIVDDPRDDSWPVDCSVEEWSDWSQCSKSCGYGVQIRSRGVLSYSKNGGLPCPVLQQDALCGSMRTCLWNHFSFLSTTKRARRTRRRRRHHHGRHGPVFHTKPVFK